MPVSRKEYKAAKIKYWISTAAIFLLCFSVPIATIFIFKDKFDGTISFSLGLLFLFIIIAFFKGSLLFEMFHESCEIIEKYEKGW